MSSILSVDCDKIENDVLPYIKELMESLPDVVEKLDELKIYGRANGEYYTFTNRDALEAKATVVKEATEGIEEVYNELDDIIKTLRNVDRKLLARIDEIEGVTITDDDYSMLESGALSLDSIIASLESEEMEELKNDLKSYTDKITDQGFYNIYKNLVREPLWGTATGLDGLTVEEKTNYYYLKIQISSKTAEDYLEKLKEYKAARKKLYDNVYDILSGSSTVSNKKTSSTTQATQNIEGNQAGNINSTGGTTSSGKTSSVQQVTQNIEGESSGNINSTGGTTSSGETVSVQNNLITDDEGYVNALEEYNQEINSINVELITQASDEKNNILNADVNPILEEYISEKFGDFGNFDFTNTSDINELINALHSYMKLFKGSYDYWYGNGVDDTTYYLNDYVNGNISYAEFVEKANISDDLNEEEKWKKVKEYYQITGNYTTDFIHDCTNLIYELRQYRTKVMEKKLKMSYYEETKASKSYYENIKENDDFKTEYLNKDYDSSFLGINTWGQNEYNEVKEYLTQKEKATYFYIKDKYSYEGAKNYISELEVTVNIRKGEESALEYIRNTSKDELIEDARELECSMLDVYMFGEVTNKSDAKNAYLMAMMAFIHDLRFSSDNRNEVLGNYEVFCIRFGLESDKDKEIYEKVSALEKEIYGLDDILDEDTIKIYTFGCGYISVYEDLSNLL